MSEFSRLTDEFFAFWWRIHPADASFAGIHTYDGELGRFDDEARAEQIRQCREYLTAFERLTPADPVESIDRQLLAGRLRQKLYELENARRFARDPGIYLEHVLGALYLMAVREYAPAEDRAADAMRRLETVPRLLNEARENLTEAAPILTRTSVRVARSGLALLRGSLPLALGSALEDDLDQFRRWDNALDGAEASLVEFARWLEEELAPAAVGDFALGREGYRAALRDMHGLSDTPEALAGYGEALKRETEVALGRAAFQIDGSHDWNGAIERLKDEHPGADELVETYAEQMALARDFVIRQGLVDVPPGETLEVTATPEFLRPIIPYAAYQPPGVHDDDRTGLFYVTPPDPDAAEEALRDHATNGILITALHEAYPGHHLQFMHAYRAATEPRRVFWTPIFAEGWALYCEDMMREQGFYTDPRTRLFQLKDLLWRACRVVVDVGLHVRGWTPERAVDYMVEEAGLERPNAEIEVRRYCAEPTQPMSYAVGKREILRLRDMYRDHKGDDFDLREFHDRLLSWGTIPPSLIAEGMGLSRPA